MKTFIQQVQHLLNSIDPDTDEEYRLQLIALETLLRLSSVIDQANAQFKAGDSHATFNKEFIEALCKPEDSL